MMSVPALPDTCPCWKGGRSYCATCWALVHPDEAKTGPAEGPTMVGTGDVRVGGIGFTGAETERGEGRTAPSVAPRDGGASVTSRSVSASSKIGPAEGALEPGPVGGAETERDDAQQDRRHGHQDGEVGTSTRASRSVSAFDRKFTEAKLRGPARRPLRVLHAPGLEPPVGQVVTG